MIVNVNWWNGFTGQWVTYGSAPSLEQCANILTLRVDWRNTSQVAVKGEVFVEFTAPDGTKSYERSGQSDSVPPDQGRAQILPTVGIQAEPVKATIMVVYDNGWFEEKDMTVVGSGGGLMSDKTMWYMGGAAAILFIMWVRSNG